MIERPKMGFGIPIDKWLCGELKDWSFDLLSKDSLIKSDIFNIDKVQKLWDEHQSSNRRWHHQLWTLIMFQSWFFSNERSI